MTYTSKITADTAEDALARFRAEWPPERCKALGDAIIGTPAEQAAAEVRIVERALERREGDSPADAAVRKLVSGHKSFNRQHRGKAA